MGSEVSILKRDKDKEARLIMNNRSGNVFDNGVVVMQCDWV